MNRKPAVIVFAIFALATVVISFFMYSWHNSSENLIGVQIIDFTVDKNWWNPVGVSYGHWFNVTVKNEASNITGLFLDIGIFLNETKYEGFSLGRSDTSPSFNFSLNANETKQFEGFVLASIDSPIGFDGRNPNDEIIIQARVLLNDTVLDMRSTSF